MSQIIISKIKIRRGTDKQRKSVVLDQGELGYTTDTQRLFVGNGVLSGGNVVGNKIHSPIGTVIGLTNTTAQRGDLVYANNAFYQLTGTDYTVSTDWGYVGPAIDGTYFSLNADNKITIRSGSVGADRLSSASVGNGLQVASNVLSVNKGSEFTFDSGQLKIANEGVGAIHLDSTSFTRGISGGAGLAVGLKLSNQFKLNGSGLLEINSLSSGDLAFSNLQSDWFGAGLNYSGANQKITAEITDVDLTLTKDASGVIGLPEGNGAYYNQMASISTDDYGRVVFNQSAIYDTLTGTGSDHVTSPLSSIFAGSPNQVDNGIVPGIQLTSFNAISTNGATTINITLSSAGFLVFEGSNYTRKDGKLISRFAIPIFSY